MYNAAVDVDGPIDGWLIAIGAEEEETPCL